MKARGKGAEWIFWKPQGCEEKSWKCRKQNSL